MIQKVSSLMIFWTNPGRIFCAILWRKKLAQYLIRIYVTSHRRPDNFWWDICTRVAVTDGRKKTNQLARKLHLYCGKSCSWKKVMSVAEETAIIAGSLPLEASFILPFDGRNICNKKLQLLLMSVKRGDSAIIFVKVITDLQDCEIWEKNIIFYLENKSNTKSDVFADQQFGSTVWHGAQESDKRG